MQHPVYGLVGRGRLAGHLMRYLELESLEFCAWNRGMGKAAAEALKRADVILLAISDDAIEPFVKKNAELGDRVLVHFSGCRVIEGVHGLHPLMTFGPGHYEIETYRAIPFVTEQGSAAFEDIFPALRNPSWPITPESKPLYHAMCVMAGNFPMMLWNRCFEIFEDRLGLPPKLLAPYLERVLANAFESGSQGVTGPVARGDRETVRNNLAALGDDPFANVYRAFAKTYGVEGL